jgi:hypothetical protein
VQFKVPVVIVSALAVTSALFLGEAIAVAAASDDTSPPALVSVSLNPSTVGKEAATVVKVTVVLSDDRVGITPTAFSLNGCNGQAFLPVTRAPVRQSSVLDPATGQVHETWTSSLLVPATARGEYWASIEFRDAASNRVSASLQGPDCGNPSATVAASAIFMAPSGPGGSPTPSPQPTLPPEDPDGWVPAQIQPTMYPLRWSRATLDDQVELDRLGRRPVVDRRNVTWLLACEHDRQLDCVESIGLVSESGEYAPGKWVQGITFDTLGRPDEGIAPYSQHQTVWDIPGLNIEGKPAQLMFIGGLAGSGTLGTTGLNMDLTLHNVDFIPSTPSSPRGCRHIAEDGGCYIPPDFPEDARLRVVVRTSWLAPSGITARGTDVTVKGADLGGGAYRWEMTGNPMLVQSRGGRVEVERGYPTWVVSSFYFMMIDPRLTGTPESECSVFRPILFSGNAQGLDTPRWKASEGRLDLAMEAPHYWADGRTEWRGYYETSIPGRTAECLWGIDPRMTSYMSVGVYSSDGEEKAATTSIAYQDGMVQIRAYDFTFSTNVVSTRVTAKIGQRCFTQGAQLKDLLCTKKGKRLVWIRAKR